MATEVSQMAAVPPVSRGAGAGASLFTPTIDLLAAGGLSLVVLTFLSGLDYVAYTVPLATVGLLGNYLIAFPHYAATYFRAYSGWGEIQRYFGVCVLVPLLLLGFALLAIRFPETWAIWFGKAYLLTSGYHYSGQTYGIALIFAGKARLALSRAEKYLLMAPIYTSYCYLLGFKEREGAPGELIIDQAIPPLGLPGWVMPAGALLFGAGLAMYVAWSIYRHRSQQPLPTICHVVVGSQVLWFVWGAGNAAYGNLVPIFHCLQYLLITCFFYFKSVLSGTATKISMVHMFATRAFLRYYAGLVVVGFFMFELVYRPVVWAGVAELGVAAAVAVSFINLHHFLMDGRIWKLRRPDVGKVVLQPAIR